MAQPKIVKRYANRKLYDTERSCYVTLEDIAAMIKGGEEVRVVDNKNGEDLTSVTLAQIIFETEKKNNFMPLGLLRELIQNGGEAINEFAKERVDRVQAKAQDIKESAQRLRTDLQGRLGLRREGDGAARPPEVLSDLLESSRRAFDDLHKVVEERIQKRVGGITRFGPLGKEMTEIRDRLAALESRIEKLGDQA